MLYKTRRRSGDKGIRKISRGENKNLINPPVQIDRGLQYCSYHYVKLLQDYGIEISMTQNGDPRENAVAERMNGILKDELLEVCYPTFASVQEANFTTDYQQNLSIFFRAIHYLQQLRQKSIGKEAYSSNHLHKHGFSKHFVFGNLGIANFKH